MEAYCDSNCPGCIKCQNSTTGNNINIMTDFNQYLPKRPSALVTIGSVLKALIDNGILTWDNDGVTLKFTQIGCYLIGYHKVTSDSPHGATQLKLEIEV